jgi:hypothetical protein
MKDISYTIIAIIFFSLVFALAVTSPKTEICGDGICQDKEIKEGKSLCDLDCKEQCITATGSIEKYNCDDCVNYLFHVKIMHI